MFVSYHKNSIEKQCRHTWCRHVICFSICDNYFFGLQHGSSSGSFTSSGAAGVTSPSPVVSANITFAFTALTASVGTINLDALPFDICTSASYFFSSSTASSTPASFRARSPSASAFLARKMARASPSARAIRASPLQPVWCTPCGCNPYCVKVLFFGERIPTPVCAPARNDVKEI